MEAQLFLQKTIRERLDEYQARNGQFSLRAFSRLLQVSPASLSEFLNGKRKLSPKMMKKLADKLCLSPEENNELQDKILREKKAVIGDHSKNANAIQLKNDQYFIVADWHYYAIRALAVTKEFKEDIPWIATRLKTTEAKVKEALDRLIRIGLMTYDDNGKLVKANNIIFTSEDIPNTSLRKRHHENLEMAKESLHTDDVMIRDFSFMTVAIDPERLPEIKKMVRDFQDQLYDFVSGGEAKEVYEVCMQIFPRSNVKKDKVYEDYQ